MDDSPVTPFRSFNRRKRLRSEGLGSPTTASQVVDEDCKRSIVATSPSMVCIRTRGVPTPIRQRVSRKSGRPRKRSKELEHEKTAALPGPSPPRLLLPGQKKLNRTRTEDRPDDDCARPCQQNASGGILGVETQAIPTTDTNMSKRADDQTTESIKKETHLADDRYFTRLSEILELRNTEPEEQLYKFQRDAEERMKAGNELILQLKQAISEEYGGKEELRTEVKKLTKERERDQSTIESLSAMQQTLTVEREQLQAELERQTALTTAAEETLRQQPLVTVESDVSEETKQDLARCKQVIDCYKMLTGYNIEFAMENENTRHFQCHFTDSVNMEGHGFSLTHHHSLGEVEYSPLLEKEDESMVAKAKKRRKSVGRMKLKSLPDYLCEEIYFNDVEGGPHFTMLMLQSLKGRCIRPPSTPRRKSLVQGSMRAMTPRRKSLIELNSSQTPIR